MHPILFGMQGGRGDIQINVFAASGKYYFFRDIKQGAKPEGERKKCQKHIVLPATPMGSTLTQLSPIYQNNGPYKR